MINRSWKTARGAAVIGIDRNNKVVLVKRTQRPLIGLWTVPMGHIEKGEIAEQAAIREFIEETGLSVRIVKKLDNFENEDEDIGLALFLGDVETDEQPIPNDDVSSAGYFSLQELPLDQKKKIHIPESEAWAFKIHEQIMKFIEESLTPPRN